MYFAVPYGVLKYTRPLPAIYILVSAVKIAAMILLLKPLGVYGVILSTALSVVVEIALLKHFIHEKLKARMEILHLQFVFLRRSSRDILAAAQDFLFLSASWQIVMHI